MFRLSLVFKSLAKQRQLSNLYKCTKLIDFLKISVSNAGAIEQLKNNELFEWLSNTESINHFDKEVIRTKTVKQYNGIIFCFYSSKVDILFKPHYNFNKGLHNANDFNIKDCIKVITSLKSLLNIDLELLKIVNIEFGINIVAPCKAKDFISYLLYHERNEFKTDEGLSFSKKSYKSNTKGVANQYKIIKVYIKHLQFPDYCEAETIRIEVKSKQSKYINTVGIFTVNDLLRFEVYKTLGAEILNECNKLLIIDCNTDFSDLRPLQQLKINEYLNTLTWFKISQDTYKNRFNKERNKYMELINLHPDNLISKLRTVITNKIELLKSGYVSTVKSKSNHINESKKSGYNSTKKNNPTKEVEKTKSGYHSNYYIGGNVTNLENCNTDNTGIRESIKTPLKTKTETKIKLAGHKTLLSYSEQKKIVDAHNAIAVALWNAS